MWETLTNVYGNAGIYNIPALSFIRNQHFSKIQGGIIMEKKFKIITGIYAVTTAVGAYALVRTNKQKRELMQTLEETKYSIDQYRMKTEEALDNMKHTIDRMDVEYKNAVSHQDAENRIMKIENDRLTKIIENVTQELKDAQLTIQDQDLEIKSLQGIVADYEYQDELAAKL